MNDVEMIAQSVKSRFIQVDDLYRNMLDHVHASALSAPVGFEGEAILRENCLHLKIWQGTLTINKLSWAKGLYSIIKPLMCKNFSIYMSWTNGITGFCTQPAFGFHYTHIDVLRLAGSILCIGGFNAGKRNDWLEIGKELADCYQTINMESLGAFCLPTDACAPWREFFHAGFHIGNTDAHMETFLEKLEDAGLIKPFWNNPKLKEVKRAGNIRQATANTA